MLGYWFYLIIGAPLILVSIAGLVLLAMGKFEVKSKKSEEGNQVEVENTLSIKVVSFGIVLCFLGVSLYMFGANWLDLPAVVSGNFYEVEGNLVETTVLYGDESSIDNNYSFEINGEEFVSRGDISKFDEKRVKAWVLPYTGILMKMETTNELENTLYYDNGEVKVKE